MDSAQLRVQMNPTLPHSTIFAVLYHVWITLRFGVVEVDDGGKSAQVTFQWFGGELGRFESYSMCE